MTLGSELAALPLARPLANRSISSAQVGAAVTTSHVDSMTFHNVFIESLLLLVRLPCRSTARQRNQVD